jgi:hypothetical protein
MNQKAEFLGGAFAGGCLMVSLIGVGLFILLAYTL